MTSRQTNSPFHKFRWTPAIIFASVAAIYMATLTKNYYWDGITFALQIEKVAMDDARASLLFHQNHLLYNALAYSLYSALSTIGLSVRALDLMQISNALIGAAAVTLLYRIVERATESHYVAVVASTALAASAVWWKLSTDADAYILSLLFILICAHNLLGPRPRWHVAGAALAGAMLIHQIASLFFIAAIVAILFSKTVKRKLRFIIALSAVAWLPTIAAYYACAVFFHGLTEPLEVIRWSLSNETGVSASANPVRGLLLLPRGNLDLIIGHRFDLIGQRVGWFVLIAASVAAFISIALARALIKEGRLILFLKSLRDIKTDSIHKQIAFVVAAWVGAYILFLIFWEPWQVYYRVFYAPAIAIMVAALLNHFHRSTDNAPWGAAALTVAALALFNLAFYVAPNMRAESNSLVAAAREAAMHWDEQTMILYGKRNEADTAFEYFNIKSDWQRIRAASPDYLDSLIERTYNEGRGLWLNKGAVETVDEEWLRKRATGREIRVDAPGAPALYVELVMRGPHPRIDIE